MSAPTGQICTVLPEKYDANGSSGNVITWVSLPRLTKWINLSPATSSAKRVQRSHRMHRSRSSRTRSLIGIGFSKWRFSSTYRLSPGPWLIAWSWSGHSPPLSHTGQSSGWLARNSSSTPCWARLTLSVAVRTTWPSATGVMHDTTIIGPRGPSTSTMHCRHMPTEVMRGW